MAQQSTQQSAMQASMSTAPTETKLCLAFCDNLSASSRESSGTIPATNLDRSAYSMAPAMSAAGSMYSARDSVSSRGCPILTSHMTRDLFNEQLLHNCSGASDQWLLPESESRPFEDTCLHRAGFWVLAGRISARTGSHGSYGGGSHRLATPATAVLVFLISVMVADVMLFVLMGSLLWKASLPLFILWLLFPPVTQPLAIALFPWVIVSENPRVGRMFTMMVALSLVNTLLTLLVQLIFYSDSWTFHILQSVIVCLVKAVVIICANAHITSLDSAHDLSFVDAQQADSICGILSGEVNVTSTNSNSASSTHLRPRDASSGDMSTNHRQWSRSNQRRNEESSSWNERRRSREESFSDNPVQTVGIEDMDALPRIRSWQGSIHTPSRSIETLPFTRQGSGGSERGGSNDAIFRRDSPSLNSPLSEPLTSEAASPF